MKTVSVILTTYNSQNTLQRTLNSIHSQKGIGDLFNLELIVIDDCSTDDTPKILQYNKIEYCSTNFNSGGPNTGRNIGLGKAIGDYICFIDHDDEWACDKIKHQLQAAQYAPIVSTGYEVVDTSTRHRVVHCPDTCEATTLYRRNATFLNMLSRNRHGQLLYFSTLMISKDLKDILFEDSFGMVDYDWMVRLCEGQKTVQINKPLMTRHINGRNLSLNHEYRKREYYYSLLVAEAYEVRYPKEVSLARKRINGSRARYFYLVGEMKQARRYFKQSFIDIKTLLYYATTFYGSHLVKRQFRIFG